VLAVILIAGGAILALTTFSKKVFDADAMNRDVAAQYKDKYGEKVDVTCPTNQAVKRNATFTCSIKDRTEKIEIKVTSDGGDYTWKPQT
jgi:hypothetical protein